MKSKFTLIELIVVIVILGVLASIVIPNISSYSKEAKISAMYADARNIETAVDKFALEHNGGVPTSDGTPAVKGIPEKIILDKLDSNYLKTKPKSTLNFYLEESGHVFPLLGKLPTEYEKKIANGDTKFVVVFDDLEDIKNIDHINVVQVENDKVKEIVESINNKDLKYTERPDGKYEMEITIKTPADLDGNDLALVVVDKAKNESPIINGGVSIGNSNDGNGGNTQPPIVDSGTEGPTINLTEQDSWTNGNITVTVDMQSDNTVNVKKWASGEKDIAYFKNDGTLFTGSTFTVSDNGIYSVYGIDNKGKERVSTVSVTKKDVVSPTGSISANQTEDESVMLTITAIDSQSGVASIRLPDNSDVNGNTATYRATSNGVHNFIITDNAGNTSTLSQSVNSIIIAEPAANFVYSKSTMGSECRINIKGYKGSNPNLIIPKTIEGCIVFSIDHYGLSNDSTNGNSPVAFTSVVIPDTMRSIGRGAFANNKLTTVVIPDSVWTIDQYAFASNLLSSVKIGESVGTIDNGAFANNPLTVITIPDSVQYIGYSVFEGDNLNSVTFGNNTKIKTVQYWSFTQSVSGGTIYGPSRISSLITTFVGTYPNISVTQGTMKFQSTN